MFLGAKKPPTIVRKVAVATKKDDQKTNLSSQTKSVKGSLAHKGSDHIYRPKNHSEQRTNVTLANGRLWNKGKNSKQHLSLPSTSRLKRKTRSPSAPQWDSDTETEDEEQDGDVVVRKRLRSSSMEPGYSVDPNRTIFKVYAVEENKSESTDMIHCAAIVSRDLAKDYKNDLFGEGLPTDDIPIVKLQYPGNYPKEEFALVQSKEIRGYKPSQDLIDAIEVMCQYYFPPDKVDQYTNNMTGFMRRLTRARAHRDLAQFRSIVGEFNQILLQALADGSLIKTMDLMKTLPLTLVERILDQIYSRTVSPEVHLLSKYDNGTSNVYGELLPRFSHTIFKETNLRSDQIFVDLGSGVGNVALQAALEIGCESWGIEQMPNPAQLGQKQVAEFEARCKRWSISHGKVKLIEGDFLENSDINEIISRADVILINNQVFTPELNNNITMKFLDVKEGARIVSLKSFVPDGWIMKQRNLNDLRNKLQVVKKQYWSNSVSWTDEGGDYYIATVDSKRLQKFALRHKDDSS